MAGPAEDRTWLASAPVVMADPISWFRETSDRKPVRLVDVRAIGDVLALLTYQPVRDA